jgi:hypothetical protein
LDPAYRSAFWLLLAALIALCFRANSNSAATRIELHDSLVIGSRDNTHHASSGGMTASKISNTRTV